MIRFLSKANRVQLQGTALLRLDFNTRDDWRMRAVTPTIQLLLKRHAKIVIVSHRGRPNGVDKNLSLRKDAPMLRRLIKTPVRFIDHFRFAEIKKMVASAPAGSVFLLENLRFLKGEEENDAGLARHLASLADFYVNDAFAVSHRADASVVAVTKFLPSFAGLEMEREIVSLGRVITHPKKPVVLILGGAKAGDKLGVIQYFKNKADWFLLGGGPANTILFLDGVDVGQSLRDSDPRDLKALARIARFKNLVLPNPSGVVWKDDVILDIGAKAAAAFKKKIAIAGTIIWSGPMGLIEKPAYAHGSLAVARAIARNRRAFSVTGGGETVSFLKKHKLDTKFGFISTGGGAMVDFLAGEKLPGIAALAKAPAAR